MNAKYAQLMISISKRKMVIRGLMSISVLIAFLYVSFYLFREMDHMTTLGISAVTAVLAALSTILVKIFAYYLQRTPLEEKINQEIEEDNTKDDDHAECQR